MFEISFGNNKNGFSADFEQTGDPINADFSEVIVRSEKDYEKLINLPSIEGVPLIGDKTFPQLNLQSLSNAGIEQLLTI